MQESGGRRVSKRLAGIRFIPKAMRKKIRKFCRLYKYTCVGCQKIKHRRHFAVPGETMCPLCLKKAELLKNQKSLFDQEEKKCETCGGTGFVDKMEQVYAGEPHMAPTGSEPCPDCVGVKEPDEADDQSN